MITSLKIYDAIDCSATTKGHRQGFEDNEHKLLERGWSTKLLSAPCHHSDRHGVQERLDSTQSQSRGSGEQSSHARENHHNLLFQRSQHSLPWSQKRERDHRIQKAKMAKVSHLSQGEREGETRE